MNQTFARLIGGVVAGVLACAAPVLPASAAIVAPKVAMPQMAGTSDVIQVRGGFGGGHMGGPMYVPHGGGGGWGGYHGGPGGYHGGPGGWGGGPRPGGGHWAGGPGGWHGGPGGWHGGWNNGHWNNGHWNNHWHGGGWYGPGWGWGGGWGYPGWGAGYWGPGIAIGWATPGYWDTGYYYSPYGYNGSPYGYGYNAPVYRGGGHVAWCRAHYRTYDARTNTFVGRGGVRYQCRGPY